MKKLILYSLLWFGTSHIVDAQIDQTNNMLSSSNTKVKSANHMPDNMNAIKLNLLSPFYSNLSIAYQRVLNEDNSIQFGASYMDFSGVFNESSSSSNIDYSKSNEVTRMFSFTPEYRFNLTGQYLSGVYFGSFLRYINMDYNFDKSKYDYNTNTYIKTSEKYTYNTLGVGVLVGSQLLYKRKITFDAYLGPVYNILISSNHSIKDNNDIQVAGDIPTLFIRGYGIRAGVTIGFGF